MQARARLGHVPALDGVRGLAVLLVVACHALAVGGGFLGVEIFFVLSGFLITTLLLEEQETQGEIRLGRFYIRRIRRLYPALAAVLAAWLGLAALGLTPRSLPGESIGVLVSGTYLANAAQSWFYALPEGLRHLWSLAMEEQFYLLWPPLLVLVLSKGAGGRALLKRLLAAALLITVVRSGLSVSGHSVQMLYESPVTAGAGLMLGCAVGVWRRNGLPSALLRGQRLPLLGLASLGFLTGLAWKGPGATDRVYYSWLMALVDVAAALLVLAVVIAPRSGVGSICSFGWLTWCGRISYSLYLVHPIVLVVAVIAHHWLGPSQAIGVSFLLAAALHRFVEQPLRRGTPFRVRPERETPAPAPA
jgi:peptidoglycan/LPS O-acetylase OafA/YrhL